MHICDLALGLTTLFKLPGAVHGMSCLGAGLPLCKQRSLCLWHIEGVPDHSQDPCGYNLAFDLEVCPSYIIFEGLWKDADKVATQMA